MGDIYIKRLESNGLRYISHLETSKDLKCFIKSNHLFVEYDADIFTDESILNIPLTATVLPLAWLSGSDIYVDQLDKHFKESMDKIQIYFKDMYPLIPFTTKIHVAELVDNKIHVKDVDRRTGLLFSGGVDSTYSMISNIQSKPRLIMHWGVDRRPYPIYKEYWSRVNDTYNKLADKYDLHLNLIKTNVQEILNLRRIEHRYHKELFYGSFWVRLQHSFVLLSLAAPLSMERFDKLLIAASGWSGKMPKYNPYPQIPETDEKIAWADLFVKHDGYIERYKKTRKIIEFFKDEGTKLRVCLNYNDMLEGLNCCKCEKCYRTIAQIVQLEVDPKNYGFKVDNSTWERMRRYYTNKNELEWSDLNTQKLIPHAIEYDLHGSKAYFEWLREFKPSDKKDVWRYRDLYDYLPYLIAKFANEIYKIFNINIYEDPTPQLPEYKVEYLKTLISRINPEWDSS